MTTNSRLLALAAAVALALPLVGCAATPAPTSTGTATPPASETDLLVVSTDGPCATGDEGVTVLVDSSVLGGGEKTENCVSGDGALPAEVVLDTAGVTTEGTVEYGDQVVCRVNGIPSATDPIGSTEDPDYVEACQSMPAAFAYWSLWVRPAGGEWAYAEEGLETLRLQPGESLALLFVLDGAPATP